MGISSFSPMDRALRPYQSEDVALILRQLEEQRAVLAVEATGLGKTVMGAELAKEFLGRWPGARVLWAVTGEELCEQARAQLAATTGTMVSLEMAGYKACGTRIVVGSVPTLKGRRLESWPKDSFDLIIFDEAHHAVADTPRAIFEHFKEAKIVGFTATPTRHDGKAQGIVFDSIVPGLPDGSKGRQMYWGWENGYLVRPRGWEEVIDGVDLSKIKTIAGDLAKHAIEEEMLKVVSALAHITSNKVGDRQNLMYTPGVGSAHGVCAALNKLRYGCARVVDGKTPRDEREQILKAFRREEFQHLVNCLVYREGVDIPNVRAITITRPTKSQTLYIQMAGRGGRTFGVPELPTVAERIAAIAASTKPDFLLLDLTGKAGKHSLQSFVTLDGRYDEKEQKRAKKLIESDPDLRVDEALQKARGDLAREEKARLEVVAMAAKAAEVRSRGREFDPFVAYGIKDPEDGALDVSWQVDPPTPLQIGWARRRGIPTDGVSKAQMTKLRRADEGRVKAGLADIMTLNLLRQNGVNVTTMRADKARSLLNEIARRGWTPEAAVQAMSGGK